MTEALVVEPQGKDNVFRDTPTIAEKGAHVVMAHSDELAFLIHYQSVSE